MMDDQKSLNNNKKQYDLKGIKYRNRCERILTEFFLNMNIFNKNTLKLFIQT